MGQGLVRSRQVSRWGLWLGGSLILLAAVVVGIDVVLRKLFAISLGGSDELSGYALAVGSTWAMAGALLDRAHVRIDSLYARFAPTVRIALDLVGLVLFILFFGLIAWRGLGVVMQSWEAGARSQSALEIPTVIPQTIWLAGLAGFVIVAGVLLATALVALLRGDLRSAQRLVGTRSAEEEVREEIGLLHGQHRGRR